MSSDTNPLSSQRSSQGSSQGSNDSPWSLSLQELSIKRIDCARLERDYRVVKNPDKDTETPNLEALAKFIISQYNVAHKFVDGNPLFNPLEISAEKWEEIDTKQFSILPFYCFTQVGNPITRMFVLLGASDKSAQQISYLFLLYRVHETVKEMFALSCGNRGYQPIQPYADYTFPRKIALRILNPTERSKETSKRIIGPVFSSTEILRSTVLFDPNSLQKIYTEFQASLRSNSSIHQIFHFQIAGEKVPQKTVEVEVKEGLVRFHKQLPFSAYPLILDHLATIARGEETYLYPSKGKQEVEKDAKEEFAFLEYFTPVSFQRYLALEKHLFEELARALNKAIMLDWTLTPPHAGDYFKAHDFRLRYVKTSGSPIITNWQDQRKAFQEVMKMLKSIPHLQLPEGALARELRNVYIDFRIGSGWTAASLSDCLIGQVRVELEKKSHTFFKLNQRWYEISANLLSRVDAEFRKLLIECLIREKQEGFLDHPWQSAPQDLTYKSIAEAVKKEEGLVEAALAAQVSFLDDQGIVQHSTLEGDILSNPVIHHFRKEIELLLNQQVVTEEDFVKALGKASFAKEALAELKKKRPIAETKVITEKNKEKKVVVIRNPFPAKDNLLFAHKAKLKEWVVKEDYTMHEGPYNEGYLYTVNNKNKPYTLEENGWFVGDRIEVNGIELFDVAHYTKNTIYLYHVKKSFDKARDALSQVMNAARVLSTAGNQRDKFLSGFFDEVIKKPKKSDKNFAYFDAARNQFLAWGADGKKKFLELFEKRKIVFVYALADDRVKDRIITEEGLKKEQFTEKDFAQDKTTLVSKNIFEFLKKEKFLGADGKKGDRFPELYDIEVLKFDEALMPYRKIVWELLTGDIGLFRSLIGRMDLLHTRAQVEGLGLGFKVCQILPPGYSQDFKMDEVKALSWGGLDEALSTQLQQQTQEKLLFYWVPGWFEGAECWVSQPTLSDGSCAFHALLGKPVDGVIQGDAELMRNTFVEELKAHLSEEGDKFTDQTLQDLYEANIKSMIQEAEKGDLDSQNSAYQTRKCAKMVFRSGNKNLADFEKYITSDAHKKQSVLVKEIFAKATERNDLTKALKAGSQSTEKDFFQKLSDDEDLRLTAVRESLKELKELTKTPTYKCLSTHLKNFEKISQQKEKEKNEILLHSKDIMENFLSCLQDTDYWLSDDELQMLAHVNNLRVEIMRADGEDYGCNNHLNQLPRDADTRDLVVIQATHNHFSKCTKHQ